MFFKLLFANLFAITCVSLMDSLVIYLVQFTFPLFGYSYMPFGQVYLIGLGLALWKCLCSLFLEKQQNKITCL